MQVLRRQTKFVHTGGGTVIQGKGRLKAQQDITVLANGSLSHQGSVESVKGTVHLEAAKPLLQDGNIPSNISVNGSIKSAKHTAILADDHISTKTSNLKVSDGFYLQAGKNLNLNADADFISKNISLKANGSLNISCSGKTLNAMQNIEADAYAVSITNTHFNVRTGSMNLHAAKANIVLNNTKLNTAQHLGVAASLGSVVTNNLHAVSARSHVSVSAGGNADLNGSTVLQAYWYLCGLNGQRPFESR